jgi:CheY-like chemotaxis protein
LVRILIVEDEPTIASALAMALGRFGYEAETAAHGQAALERIWQDPLPDLVMMDLCMPVLDGKSLLGALRREPRLLRLPVILLTGADTADLPAEGSYQGVIVKPFRVQEVLELVARTVSRGETVQ